VEARRMNDARAHRGLITLTGDHPIWERFFTVAPLVLVGTREEDGSWDLAPKHLAMPLGWENYFCFACTPGHRTYLNARREEFFTVSFPRPSQVLLTSLAAAPRCEDDSKPSLHVMATFPANRVKGELVEDAYLHLECALARIVDGFGPCSLVVGSILEAHVSEAALRRADKDDHDLLSEAPLLAYLSPGRYARIRKTKAFPFHKGWSR
jgi:flavin reductase (DIM6/NTAB) family NADH-FMN oxidoreductase RutF